MPRVLSISSDSIALDLVLDLLPERRLRVTDRDVFHVGVLFKQFSLFLVELPRDDELEDHDEFAPFPTPEVRQSVPGDAEDLPLLRPGWDFQ